MDKKSKKQLGILRQRLQKLRQQIAAETQQPDDPQDLQRLQADLEKTSREIEQLVQAG